MTIFYADVDLFQNILLKRYTFPLLLEFLMKTLGLGETFKVVITFGFATQTKTCYTWGSCLNTAPPLGNVGPKKELICTHLLRNSALIGGE